MKDFMDGFIKGAKKTPRAFFAPAVAVWRLAGQYNRFTAAMNIRRIIRNSIRLYFAPLVGAYRGWRAEMLRQDRRYRDYSKGNT